MTKTCSKCGKKKRCEDFYARSDKAGFRSVCKECYAKKSQAYYKAHIPEYRARDAEWRKKNPHKQAEYSARYATNHVEELRIRTKSRYWNNRDKELQRLKKSRDKNRDKWRGWWRDWNRKNRAKCNANYNKYRARKSGNGGFHTTVEWSEMMERYNGLCLGCGEHKKLTKDHVVPISLGGTDYISNIQPLCLTCNARKGNRTIVDYR